MARKLLLRDLPEELRRIVVDVRRLLEGFGSIPGTRQEPFNSKRSSGCDRHLYCFKGALWIDRVRVYGY